MATQISCLCNRASQTVSLDWSPESKMDSPSVLALCHCPTCRRTTGSLCTSYVPLKQGTQSAPNLKGLLEYVESTAASRWFCETCGAHVFLQFKGDEDHDEQFKAARGTIADIEPQTESITHLSLDKAVDGSIFNSPVSATGVLQSGMEISICFTGATCTVPVNTTTSLTSDRISEYDPQNSSTPPTFPIKTLTASCQCEGVKFHINPPDHTSRLASSPWPDVLVPYHSPSTSPSIAAANPNDAKWWLCANGTKYLAGLCACNSCRLASGFPIQSWAFVSRSNIFKASDGSNMNYDNLGTLKRYQSSPGIYREFCGVCGATIFWHCDERPGVVDVSIGLLRAETGVKAEDWLHWELGRISFEEEALDRGMVRCLKEGISGVGVR